MLLNRETNRRCNVVEWLIENRSMTIDEAIEVLAHHHFNADSVQRSFNIQEEAMSSLMV